jgi:cell filamentation protein
LGPIYAWAGEYRSLNIGKAGFQFAHAPLIPGLMAELQRGALARLTPCSAAGDAGMARALAEVHAELILVHPFREGNGRLARLLALLMALQAGLPPLDFSPLTGAGKRAYIAGIHAAVARNYAPLTAMFLRVIERSRRRAVSSAR